MGMGAAPKEPITFKIKQDAIVKLQKCLLEKTRISPVPAEREPREHLERFCQHMTGAPLPALCAELNTHEQTGAEAALPKRSPYKSISKYLFSIHFLSPSILKEMSIVPRFFSLLPVWIWMLIDLGEASRAQQAKILPNLPLSFGPLKLPLNLVQDESKARLEAKIVAIQFNYDRANNTLDEAVSPGNGAYPFLFCAFTMFGYLCLMTQQEANKKCKWARLLYQVSMMLLQTDEPSEKKLPFLMNMVHYVGKAHVSNLTFFQSRGRFDQLLEQVFEELVELNEQNKRNKQKALHKLDKSNKFIWPTKL
jgi:hypothetical protein